MPIEHQSESIIAGAVRAAGSQSAFGRLVGVRQSTVNDWLRRGQVSHHHVLRVEDRTGISRHELRPDLYPRDAAPASSRYGDMEPAR